MTLTLWTPYKTTGNSTITAALVALTLISTTTNVLLVLTNAFFESTKMQPNVMPTLPTFRKIKMDAHRAKTSQDVETTADTNVFSVHRSPPSRMPMSLTHIYAYITVG
ncbi:hypothetical protein ACLMJK_007119 [Lecanora helva]